jgi:hypothetical protein
MLRCAFALLCITGSCAWGTPTSLCVCYCSGNGQAPFAQEQNVLSCGSCTVTFCQSTFPGSCPSGVGIDVGPIYTFCHPLDPGLWQDGSVTGGIGNSLSSVDQNQYAISHHLSTCSVGCSCCASLGSVATLDVNATNVVLSGTSVCRNRLRARLLNRGHAILVVDQSFYGPFILRSPAGIMIPGPWSVSAQGYSSSCFILLQTGSMPLFYVACVAAAVLTFVAMLCLALVGLCKRGNGNISGCNVCCSITFVSLVLANFASGVFVFASLWNIAMCPRFLFIAAYVFLSAIVGFIVAMNFVYISCGNERSRCTAVVGGISLFLWLVVSVKFFRAVILKSDQFGIQAIIFYVCTFFTLSNAESCNNINDFAGPYFGYLFAQAATMILAIVLIIIFLCNVCKGVYSSNSSHGSGTVQFPSNPGHFYQQPFTVPSSAPEEPTRQRCLSCGGSGRTYCSKCNHGKVTCNNCSNRGYVTSKCTSCTGGSYTLYESGGPRSVRCTGCGGTGNKQVSCSAIHTCSSCSYGQAICCSCNGSGKATV